MSAVEWSPVDQTGRIESPAERTVVDSTPRQEGVGREPGIPEPAIPSAPAPARAPEGIAPPSAAPALGEDGMGRIDVGFGYIVRPQAAPAVEIVFIVGIIGVGFLVESLGLVRRVGRQIQCVSAFQFNLLVGILDHGFAVEDAYLIRV